MGSDSEIIFRSRERPREFGEIFRRHARVVFSYLVRRAGVDAADEVLSATFLIAFQRRTGYDHERDDARPWLLGIATNLLADHRRREARHLKLLGRALVEGADEGMSRAEERADASTLMRSLADDLRRLAPGDRDTLLLYAWADLDYGQIADALGIPIGTVRSRLNRARRRLQLAQFPDSTKETPHARPGTAPQAG